MEVVMQHQQRYGVMKMALRARICTQCHLRPNGSDVWLPIEERECEKSCPIFTNLPKILRMINQTGGEPPYGYEVGIRNYVCQTCKESQTAGDYCVTGLTRECPLS